MNNISRLLFILIGIYIGTLHTVAATPPESEFRQKLETVVESLKSQFPVKADACTTHKSALLVDKSIVIKSEIREACIDFVDFNKFKSVMCNNFKVSLEPAFVRYIADHNYSVIYLIYNENNKLRKKIVITGKDILNYHE